jgi:phage terminase large subunit-like protein
VPAGDKNTRIIVIGNLLHQDCLVMRLRREIEESILSGVVKWFPVIKSDGSIAWIGKYPDMNALAEEKKKIGNERVWRREFMLEIVADAEQIFLPEWFEKYKYEVMPGFDSPDYRGTYLGIDPAVSEKEDADKTGIVIASIFGSGENTKIYIHAHVVNQRFSFHRLKEEVIYLCQNIGPKNRVIPVVENVAAQKWLYDELRKSGLRAELFEVHGIEKSERLKIAALAVEAGKVFFPTRGIEELKTQLVGFGSERFNDLADGFSIVICKIKEINNDSGLTFFFGDKEFVGGKVIDRSGPTAEEKLNGLLPETKDLKSPTKQEIEKGEKEADLEIMKKQLEEAKWWF